MRPSLQFHRQILFNWLGGRVCGAAVLDLFAGSGALGVEALSRGAARALFVEHDRRAAAGLRRQLRQLGLGDSGVAGVRCADALRILRTLDAASMDLAFVDPPWDARLERPALDALESSGVLRPGALVYVESPVSAPPSAPPGWALERQRLRTTTALRLYSTCARAPQRLIWVPASGPIPCR